MTNRGWDSLRVQIIALLSVMVLFGAGGLVAVQVVSNSVAEMIARTAEARQRGQAASSVLAALQESETGQRGYLLTGRTSFLQPYHATINRIDALLKALERRVPDDPELRAAFATLDEAARSKVDELRRTVSRAEADGVAAAASTVTDEVGDHAMRRARDAAQAMIDQAEGERARSAQVLQRTQTQITDILLVALFGAVLLLGAAALRLVWSRHRLRLARDGERREAEQLQAAIEHVAPGVAVFDSAGILRLVNARFASALAIPPGQAAPGVAIEAIATAAAFEPPLAPEPPRLPSSREVRQGPRTLEVWRSPMPDGGQMLSVTDVTRRVHAEEVGRQAQKMDVLGQMTGGVAHDFNNLLQVVSANLELVRNRVKRALPADGGLLDRIDAASGGVARGARLTRHLLAFARRQPLAPEPIDPARLLIGLEDVLRRTVGEAIHLELVVGGHLWTMRADPVQVENALLNLALNARDSMAGPEGVPTGQLVVEVTNAALDADYAARSADVSPGQYIMFAVTDTGTGMTPDQVARATEPFFTTKGEGKGTGLGLSMVLGFAKQSGGHFQLYSEVGRGTTARLYIPRTAASAAVQPGPDMPDVPRGAGRVVLLAEDDRGGRSAAKGALLDLDYQVVEAENGDEALALLRNGLRPSILFTDVVMPGRLSARALAEQARALVPELAVLFTSGYTQNGITRNGQLDAGVTLLSKPWRTDQLARALHAVSSPLPASEPVRRVLLVEDEELVRATTADALAEMGFDVVQATTVAGALNQFNPDGGAPDLLLTDLGLPDRDGTELVDEARRRQPALPVIVASGQSEPPPGTPSDVIWLPKPFDIRGLREAVERAMSRV